MSGETGAARALTAAAALVLGAATAPLAEPQAYARHGEVMLQASGGDPVALTHVGKVADARLSPDGRRVLFITAAAPNPACDRTRLWVMAAKPGASARLLLTGHDAPDMKRKLCGLSSPRWSPDGRFAYVVSDAWVTSGAVHEVEIDTRRERFVIDGNSLSVLRGGPYDGRLLVGRHKLDAPPAPGAQDPLDVVQPDGTVILTVPGSDKDEGDKSLAPWLAANHARLS